MFPFNAGLLFMAIWISCALPPDNAAPSPATPPGRVSLNITMPDTAGIAGAYAAFLKTVPASKRDRFARPRWALFAPVDTAAGAVPCDIFEDDSLGFRVVFFNKAGGRFQFKTIRSAPAGPVLPGHRATETVGFLSADTL